MVSVARTVNGESMIAQGLQVGESVVIDGQSRLADGTLVKIAAAHDDGAAKAGSEAVMTK